ncbi:uncharacterized protein ARMOST_14068 [Armillaria ostoyae]|uniref:Uncharacterized protein n=1 Tax=Armillaria ostoyae TaxID=47428 RepID=A0A284RPJ1_ARMOS|nr:uncharacterized protein ARMOST_14068 [Armillaria ostoyae]
MISSVFLTLYFLHTVVVQEKCEKYVRAASSAASNLQSKYFTNNVDYGDQQPWIGAVDVFWSMYAHLFFRRLFDTQLSSVDKITGKQKYGNVIDTAGKRDEAKKYYDIASSAVDDTYRKGGLFWNGKRDYKNDITNELYISSGYLYEVLQDEQYLTNLKQSMYVIFPFFGQIDVLKRMNGQLHKDERRKWT